MARRSPAAFHSPLAALALPPLLLAAGCRLGGGAPEAVPLRGPMPQTIAVWPLLADAHHAQRAALLDGLDVAVRQRGYRVIPWAVATELLAGDDAPAAPAGAAARLGADAALVLVVREFAASGVRPLHDARWDLAWQLVSLRDGAVVWTFAHRGAWSPPPQFDDPHRPLDAEPDFVPIGGDRRLVYRDAGELLAALHLQALARLPARSR